MSAQACGRQLAFNAGSGLACREGLRFAKLSRLSEEGRIPPDCDKGLKLEIIGLGLEGGRAPLLDFIGNGNVLPFSTLPGNDRITQPAECIQASDKFSPTVSRGAFVEALLGPDLPSSIGEVGRQLRSERGDTCLPKSCRGLLPGSRGLLPGRVTFSSPRALSCGLRTEKLPDDGSCM
jgi:hypothetical protein